MIQSILFLNIIFVFICNTDYIVDIYKSILLMPHGSTKKIKHQLPGIYGRTP